MRILEAQALSDFKIHLKFDGGASGEVDLSDLAGQGVFAAWNEPGVFSQVRIGSEGELIWNDRIDLCPDSLYLRMTHKRPEELFPNLREQAAHA